MYEFSIYTLVMCGVICDGMNVHVGCTQEYKSRDACDRRWQCEFCSDFVSEKQKLAVLSASCFKYLERLGAKFIRLWLSVRQFHLIVTSP